MDRRPIFRICQVRFTDDVNVIFYLRGRMALFRIRGLSFICPGGEIGRHASLRS